MEPSDSAAGFVVDSGNHLRQNVHADRLDFVVVVLDILREPAQNRIWDRRMTQLGSSLENVVPVDRHQPWNDQDIFIFDLVM
ncbi:hypothetical protein OGAPHI_003207 [Ogataea philodendri]|uniref:Uncharacterized protein n=1 Tax=Ogataea philodendri TaxID=1378263 RepID=A0A9P8P6L0_9ASCO|nr:uncharacterized protein OGAPHI_003207 [Ogataea philodendri]KAH3666758.1 hypothetical protein OGAPHI_003207 [Ogataea philodendri]